MPKYGLLSWIFLGAGLLFNVGGVHGRTVSAPDERLAAAPAFFVTERGDDSRYRAYGLSYSAVSDAGGIEIGVGGVPAFSIGFERELTDELGGAELSPGRFYRFSSNGSSTPLPLFSSLAGQLTATTRVEILARQKSLKFNLHLTTIDALERATFRVGGADHVGIGSDEALHISTPVGDFQLPKPITYAAGGRLLDCRYVLLGEGMVGFQVHNASADEPIVIDPVIEFIGSVQGLGGADVAIDERGNAYIVSNDRGDIVPGFSSGNPFPRESLVLKLGPGGDVLVWAAEIPGDATKVDVNAAGEVAVGGQALVGMSGIPGFNNCTPHGQPSHGAFASKLSPDGTQFRFYACLSGSGMDDVHGIAFTPGGSIVMAGKTSSGDFPTTPDAWVMDTELMEEADWPGTDGFLAELDGENGSLLFSTRIGGASADDVSALAVGKDGSIFLAGSTRASYGLGTFGSAYASPHGTALYRSTTDGETWEAIGIGPPRSAFTCQVEIASSSPSTFYVLTDEPSIYRSNDGGATWTEISVKTATIWEGFVAEPSPCFTMRLAVSPQTPETLYLSTPDRAFRSRDGGVTWVRLLPTTQTFEALRFLTTSQAEKLYWQVETLILKSTDGGDTWTAPTEDPCLKDTLVVDPVASDTVYCIAYEGRFVRRSVDGGASWETFEQRATRLAIPLTASGPLYALDGRNILRSDDRGKTFVEYSASGSPVSPPFLSVGLDGDTLFSWKASRYAAGNSSGLFGEIYRIDEYQGPWNWVSRPLPGAGVFDLAFHPDGSVYVASGPGWDAWAAKVDLRERELIWSTYLGGTGNDYAFAIDVDQQGRAHIGGLTFSVDLPVAAAFQNEFRGGDRSHIFRSYPDWDRGGDGFFARLSADGSSFDRVSYLGGGRFDAVIDVATRGDEVYMVGATGSPDDFPVTMVKPIRASSQYSPFLSIFRMQSDNEMLHSELLLNKSAGESFATAAAVTARGELALTGKGRDQVGSPPGWEFRGTTLYASLLMEPLDRPWAAPRGIVDAFRFRDGPLTPGGIMSMFGLRLADGEASAGAVPLPRELANTKIWIDGIEAPLYYAGPGQVNFQTPFELQGPRAEITIAVGDKLSPVFGAAIASSSPRLFVDVATGHLIGFHEDGTRNSAENPAEANAVITTYLVGLGDVAPRPITGGAAAAEPLSLPSLDVTATIGGIPAVIEFVGLAPGLVGLGQLNIRVPEGASGLVEVRLHIGEAEDVAKIMVD